MGNVDFSIHNDFSSDSLVLGCYQGFNFFSLSLMTKDHLQKLEEKMSKLVPESGCCEDRDHFCCFKMTITLETIFLACNRAGMKDFRVWHDGKMYYVTDEAQWHLGQPWESQTEAHEFLKKYLL